MFPVPPFKFVSCANVMTVLLPHALDRSLRVVHSALCTRVLLNLRKAAADGFRNDVGDFTIQTTIAFGHPAYADLELQGEDRLSTYDLTDRGHGHEE